MAKGLGQDSDEVARAGTSSPRELSVPLSLPALPLKEVKQSLGATRPSSVNCPSLSIIQLNITKICGGGRPTTHKQSKAFLSTELEL